MSIPGSAQSLADSAQDIIRATETQTVEATRDLNLLVAGFDSYLSVPAVQRDALPPAFRFPDAEQDRETARRARMLLRVLPVLDLLLAAPADADEDTDNWLDTVQDVLSALPLDLLERIANNAGALGHRAARILPVRHSEHLRPKS